MFIIYLYRPAYLCPVILPQELRRQLRPVHYQYFISLIIIIGMASIGYAVQDIISYRAVALLLLMAVSLLAMRFDIWHKDHPAAPEVRLALADNLSYPDFLERVS